jgi:glycerol-3-phosphate dehydrogenase (NAD(P)+)
MSDARLTVGVIGGGAWGTALATVLARNGHQVMLWAMEPEVVESINQDHQNEVFLNGVSLAPEIIASGDLHETVAGRDLIVSVCPSQHVRGLVKQWASSVRSDTIIVSASKGIERGTCLLMSQVFEDVLPKPLAARLSFLSGPSFAREVALEMPTVVSIASESEELAEAVQQAFYNPTFRTYRSTDVIGVEVGGALKNVIAIATGMADGMGLGHNASAALITRGLVELTRMAVALGADPITMMGLAGLGDLILTCKGDLSRNRTVGKALGAGQSLAEVLGSMPQVAEGVETAASAFQLARRLGVRTPIIDEVYHILHEGRPVQGSVDRLMTGALTRESI